MSEDPLERSMRSLKAAGVLVEKGFYYDAVSRAYYAAFYAARAALRTKGEEPRTHSGVLTRFSDIFVRSGEMPTEASRTLRRLFQDRQGADYDEGTTVTEAEAREALALGHSFLKYVEPLFAGE